MKIEFVNLHSENDDGGRQRQDVQVQVKLQRDREIPEVQMAFICIMYMKPKRSIDFDRVDLYQ